MYSLQFGKSYFCWGTTASCSWPELRCRTLHAPLKPQSLSTRLFISYCRSFCPGVHPVSLPYLVSTMVGSSCPFLLLTGTVWYGGSCISLPLPCGSSFPSLGICLVSVLTPCTAALPATVQVLIYAAGEIAMRPSLTWELSHMRLHPAHEGQALQAAPASSSEYLSPPKNTHTHTNNSMNYRRKWGSSFCSGCNCSRISLECMSSTVQVLYLIGIKCRGTSRGRKGVNSQVKIAT